MNKNIFASQGAQQVCHSLAGTSSSKATPRGVFNFKHDLSKLELPSISTMADTAATEYDLGEFMNLPVELPSPTTFFNELPVLDFDDHCIVPELPTIATPDLCTVNMLAAELEAATVPKQRKPRRSRLRQQREEAEEADLGLTSTGHVRKRRPKVAVPDTQKDEKYWARRRKNNEAARRNRERKRAEEEAKKARVNGLDARKRELTDEVSLLQKELKALRDLVRQRLAAL